MTRRAAATVVGVGLLAVAIEAELDPGALLQAAQHVPEAARGRLIEALQRDDVLNVATAVFALLGLAVTVASWPALSAAARFAGKVGVSAIGLAVVGVAVVFVLDPGFLGSATIQAPTPMEDEHADGAVMIQAAAATLGLFGLILVAIPWRRRT